MTGLPFPSFCPFGSSFVSFLPFGPSFPLFWPFGLSFPFIVAFWAFIPFIFAFWWLASGVPPTSCQKRFVFPRSHIKNLTAPGRAPFSDFWPLGLHFLLFWPCGPSFPFIVAFWAFIFFYFCLLVASFWGPAHKLPKTVRFPKVPHKEFNSARPSSIFRFLAFGASFPFILALWAFIPRSLALWAFIFFYFGLLGLHFLSFWPFWPSFPLFWPC